MHFILENRQRSRKRSRLRSETCEMWNILRYFPYVSKRNEVNFFLLCCSNKTHKKPVRPKIDQKIPLGHLLP